MDKDIKHILNKIIINSKNTNTKSNDIYEKHKFKSIILIASVIFKYKNACIIDNNILYKGTYNLLINKFNLYIYKYKNAILITNTEIKDINKLSTYELGKILSYLTPINFAHISSTDLSCRIGITFRKINDSINEIYTVGFMEQRTQNKSILDIDQYLNKYVIAVNEIAKYIEDNYIIISTEKIIEKTQPLINTKLFEKIMINKKLTKKIKKLNLKLKLKKYMYKIMNKNNLNDEKKKDLKELLHMIKKS